jgi:hypothetical protein
MTTPVTARETVTFDVHDAAVAPMLTDASGGAAPTYGPWIDVPGIQQTSLDPELATSVLKGDARTIARKGKIDTFTSGFTYSVLSLDVLDAILGGEIDDTVAGQVSWLVRGANSLPYFKAAFAIEDLSIGLAACHVTIFKAQVTGGSLFGQSTDEFGTRNFQVSGIPTLSDDMLVDVTLFEDAADLQESA